MTDTIENVAAKAAGQEPGELAIDEHSVAEQLVGQAPRCPRTMRLLGLVQ